MSTEILNYIRPHTRTEYSRILDDHGPDLTGDFRPKMPDRCKNFGIWLAKYHYAEFTRRYLAWKAAAEAQT